MAEPEGIPMENFRALVERARLTLSTEELESLKPMYDYYAGQIASLHDVDLGAEDLAVAFSPNWDPEG